MKRLLKSVVAVLLTVLLLSVGLIAAARSGLLSPFGIESSSTDSQVIQAIERTQEVSLVSLHIEGITQEKRNSDVFGVDIPGTGEKVLLKYTFDAKLGIDGERVRVERDGENAYLVTAPGFSFIGYGDPVFEEVADDGGILRALTEDIDRAEMINKVFNKKARNKYLAMNVELLEDQTRVFYENIIKGVDPEATVSFEFSS